MGVSTDGIICYGMPVDEDSELPWRDDAKYDDIDDWWRDIHGYQEPFQLYDEDGEYLNGVVPTKEQIDAYFDHRRSWDADHPLPIEMVNVCSSEYPMWLVAVPSTVVVNSRGDCTPISKDTLTVNEEAEAALKKFIADYSIEGGQIDWYLCSYWG